MTDTNKLDDIWEAVSFIKDNAVTWDEFHKEIASIKSSMVTKDEFNNEIGGIKNEISGIKNEIGGMKKEIINIRMTMVTKEYLDDKLADQTGDITLMMRKEDAKLCALVELLEKRQVITTQERKHIFSLQPFPQFV